MASLAGLVVLKIIAWTDRGSATDDKDAHDLALLLRASASGQFAEDLWADDYALEQTEFDPERAGPFRVGRQIADDFEPALVARLRATLTGSSGQRIHDLSRTPLAKERLDALVFGMAETRPSRSPPPQVSPA